MGEINEHTERSVDMYWHKVSLRDAPTNGVAQEQIENDSACDIVSYAYDAIV